jgi:outer membrane lipoprotein-sorting protein
MINKIIILCFVNISLSSASEFLPKGLSIEFTQSYKKITGKVVSSQGHLDYQFPGKIKITESANKTVFTSNGKTSWFYVPPMNSKEKGTVQVSTEGEQTVSKLFDVLQKGLTNNDYFSVSTALKDKVLLTMTKNLGQKELTLTSVEIVKPTELTLEKFTFSHIKTMVLNYEDGRVTTFSFDQVTEKSDFAPSYFTFVVPKNTNIVK